MFHSYRAKLQAAFLILGLLAIAATYWPVSVSSTATLRQTTYDRLTAIRETKRRAVEDYFTDLLGSVQALSTDESTITALERLRAAWPLLPAVAPGDPRHARLAAYYHTLFAALANPPAAPADLLRTWLPTDPRVAGLQDLFIAGNRFPTGSKDLLVRPDTTTAYGDIHAQFHPTFQKYRTALGFYDIFLIDAADARILYSVVKEIDLGVRLTEPPYHGTGLQRAFTRALTSPGDTVIEDYAPYVASHFAPAAFVAAPITRAGVVVGVLAAQIAIGRVNRVMTGDQAWTREGMGRTGHTYIAGADRTLRSDMRFEIEDPETFFAQLARAGTPAEVVSRIRRDGTAILNLSLSDHLASSIFDTAESTEIGTDVRDVEVLRSHAALRLPGLHWVLVAEMETAEAFAPVAELRARMAVNGFALAAGFIVAAWLLARSVTRPVTALLDGTRRLAAPDFGVRLPVRSRDEIGQLADAFNTMAERLQRTTVSRDALDRANQALNAHQRELERLNARLLGAQEDERRRLARELHDDLSQRLAALAIAAGTLRQQPETAAGWRDGLRTIQDGLARVADDVHDLSRRLHSVTLEELGLAAAIEGECRGFFERGGPPVEVSISGPVDEVRGDVALALYRIVQEGLRNALRHADATEVAVRLRCDEAGVELAIEDNGRGYDRHAADWRPGIGLASMNERARLAGGRCSVRSTPGGGTTVLVTVPRQTSTDGTA